MRRRIMVPEYEAIDLGLPSGLKWANKNIGAIDEFDGGKLFQWGDTTPYDVPKYSGKTILEGEKKFDFSDSKWYDQSTESYTKYNNVDRKTVLDLEDDAAHINMGISWRMPTSDDVLELFSNI